MDKNNKIKLNRTTLATSRLMDFCSEKELVAQTGHPKESWALVILKELMDNALDACEESDLAPVISITVRKNGIEIIDNGAGIPIRTVQRVLDFTVRVSSREAYIAPDRGAQGNALKTLVMMPFIMGKGKVVITSRGVKHTIAVKVDAIRQEPVIDYKKAKISQFVKNGTSIRLYIPWCFTRDVKERFLQMADDYTFLNPHTTLNIDWDGDKRQIEAIDKGWHKWKPNEPTSAHWYEVEHLTRLIGGYIADDRDRGKDRTVREFIAEFRGLSSTAKQKKVLDVTGLTRVNLSAMVKDDMVDVDKVIALLIAMKEHTKPVKPAALGVIGKDNFTKKFGSCGCDMKTFNYNKVVGTNDDDNDLPFVIESAFGWFGENAKDERRFIKGVNWSTAILNPFRELGKVGSSLDSILEQQRIGRREPVIFLLHCAYPRIEYTDRGKSAIVIRGNSKEEQETADDDEEPVAEENISDAKDELEKKKESLDIKLLKEWKNEGETYEVGATLTITPADLANQLIADGIAEEAPDATDYKNFKKFCNGMTDTDKGAAKRMMIATNDLIFGGKEFEAIDALFGKNISDFLGKK